MRYQVMLTPNSGITPAQMEEFALPSLQVLWGLYTRDIVREMFVREDKKGIVFTMEAPTAESLTQALALIPWVAKELVTGEAIRLMPFSDIALAFVAQNQQAAQTQQVA